MEDCQKELRSWIAGYPDEGSRSWGLSGPVGLLAEQNNQVERLKVVREGFPNTLNYVGNQQAET